MELVRRRALKSSRYAALATLVVLALIWGYSWVPLKLGVAHSSPFVFAALRTLPGSLLMLLLMASLRQPLKPKAIGLTALLGLLQTSGFLGFTMGALVSGGAGRTSILANTWQFWILLMAWPILRERLQGLQWLSVVLALSGLILIIEPWRLHGVTSSLLALSGAVSFAAGSIVAKIIRRRHEVDNLSLTTWQTFFGSLVLVVLAVTTGGDAPDWSGTFVWSFLFAMLVTTCLGSFIWLYLLRELPAGIAGLGTMGTPVVGVLSSWVQLGETPTVLEVAGMLIILAGLAILFRAGLSGPVPQRRSKAHGRSRPARRSG